MSSYRTAAAHSWRAPSATESISYPALALVSALISVWLILLDPVMNNDAILTLREARALLTTGAGNGFQLQAFWPLTLAGINQISAGSLLTTAHILTGVLYVFLCLAFVATVKTLGGDTRVQLWAALLVLVHPLLGDFRSGLSRDPGYWAFALLGLRQLLSYARRPAWTTQVKWFACILLASLFRVEALILANLAPLILLLALPRRRRLGAGFRLLLPMWILSAALLLSGVLALIAQAQGSQLPADFAAWLELVKTANQLPGAVAEALPQLANSPDRDWAVAGGRLGLLFATLVSAVTATCLLLLLFGWWRGDLRRITTPARSLINAQIGIIGLYLALYALFGYRVTARDTAPAVLMLLLYLPFVLDSWWRRGLPVWKVLALAALVVLASDGLINRKFEKQYVADAAAWLRDNTPAQAGVLSNDPYIAYFSRDPGVASLSSEGNLAQLLASNSWRQYPLLAVRLSGLEFAQWYQLRFYPQLEVLRVFANRDRDMVLVLKNTAVEPAG